MGKRRKLRHDFVLNASSSLFFWRAATLCNLARVEVKEVCCSGGHIVAAVIITVFFCGALTAKKNDQGVGVRQ